MSNSADDLEYKKKIDSYSFDELIDIKNHIDQEKYHQRYEWILNRIDFLIKNDPAYVDPTKTQNVVEGSFWNLTYLKTKHIFLPFLLLAVGFNVIYSFIHYVFVIKTGWISIDQDIIDLWVPLSLPFFLIMLFLRPRILLLKVEDKKGDDRIRTLYYFIANIAIAIFTIISQEYLQTATGKLTALDKISDINYCNHSKYYSVKQYYIDKSNAGADGSVGFSGKHNQSMDFTIFISSPMLSFNTETVTPNSNVWFGKIYKKYFDNPRDDALAESKWKSFWESSISDFEKQEIPKFEYLDRLTNCSDYRGLEKAALKTHLFNSSNKNNFILVPVNSSFEERNGNKLPWIFGSLAIGSFVMLLFIIAAPIRKDKYDNFKIGKKTTNTEIKEALMFFVPREGYFICPIIIVINLLIFLAMVISGLGFISFSGQDLLSWGANYRPVTTDGQWWRLFTCIFMHGGVMHVAMNMYGLLFVGIFLEPILGKFKFASAYLLTGILSSIASIWWHTGTVSVGASGAIFGMYGLFLALLTTKLFPPIFKSSFLASTAVFVGYNLLMGLSGGIDNAAHIGGLVSGLILGYILYPVLKTHTAEEKK